MRRRDSETKANMKTDTTKCGMQSAERGVSDKETSSDQLPTLNSNKSRASTESKGDEMLTKKELMARLKVSARTIEQWQHDGHIPFLKVGSVVLFHWPAVVKQLAEKFQVNGTGAIQNEKLKMQNGAASTPHPSPLPVRGGEGVQPQGGKS